MKTFYVTAYPYACMNGTIDIPDDVTDKETYVRDHWNEIDFDEPSLDYCGTDFDIEEYDDED